MENDKYNIKQSLKDACWLCMSLLILLISPLFILLVMGVIYIGYLITCNSIILSVLYTLIISFLISFSISWIYNYYDIDI